MSENAQEQAAFIDLSEQHRFPVAKEELPQWQSVFDQLTSSVRRMSIEQLSALDPTTQRLFIEVFGIETIGRLTDLLRDYSFNGIAATARMRKGAPNIPPTSQLRIEAVAALETFSSRN